MQHAVLGASGRKSWTTTWAEAVVSAFSIWVAFRPTAAALSRSITRLMRGLFISRSVGDVLHFGHLR